MQNPHNDKLSVVTGVLPAGGSSRRMGRDKARIELGGCSLYRLPLDFLRQHFKTVFIAGDRSGLASEAHISGRYRFRPGLAPGWNRWRCCCFEPQARDSGKFVNNK